MRHYNTSRATIDFETRSECSLKQCGSWRYSLDPTTEALCLAWRLPYWEKGRTGLWHPAFPHLGIEESDGDANLEDLLELWQWLRAGELVEAHNAWFERGIWKNIMVPRWGWEPIRHEQWRCSAAKAAAHALPRKLDDVGEALEFDEEDLKDDDAAKAIMHKTMRPRESLKADELAWRRKHAGCWACTATGRIPGFKKDWSEAAREAKCPRCGGSGFDPRITVPVMPTLWHESKELFSGLWAYCRQDVIAEEAVSDRLIDLSDEETAMFLMDAAVNERGFRLDVAGVDAALEVVEAECKDLNAELFALTNGKVERATQRERMVNWLSEQGLHLENTQKDTIEALLIGDPNVKEDHLTRPVRRGLELMKTLGRSSTSKYVKMRDWVCPADGRVRGGLLYHGASTGRWSGQGVQPHNFVKGSIKDMIAAWEAIHSRDRIRIAALPDEDGEPYADVMEVLSYALRGAIVPSEGHQLYVADYAAIEARVVLWLAEDTEALQVFENAKTCGCEYGGCSKCDIYLNMASAIWGGKHFTKKNKFERGIGKIAILGLGYQMGWSKFQATALKGKVKLDDLFAQQIVETYREHRWRVKQMWYDQERAAIQAVTDGEAVSGYIRWLMDDGFLRCELPSGRWLSYPNPEVDWATMPWGAQKLVLTYETVNQYNRQWNRQKTYGGMLVENITQAVARDLMACAMLRCERSGTYTPILSVHDELIAEALIGTGSVKEFEHLMAECPAWAAGCPVTAEGWAGLRYRK